VVPNKTEELRYVRDFVRSAVSEGNIEKALENRILLAVDEAVSNIIEHAYDEGRFDAIEIFIDINPNRLEVKILDSGNHFDPELIRSPDIDQKIRMGHKGGLGIFLMRQVMDEVEYIFKEGVRNELRMVKYLMAGRP
jgi:serine/threonine-protein kinase RsbW